MKRFTNCLAFILFTIILCGSVSAATLLVPGGQLIGLNLENGSVTVAAIDEALGAGAKEAVAGAVVIAQAL